MTKKVSEANGRGSHSTASHSTAVHTYFLGYSTISAENSTRRVAQTIRSESDTLKDRWSKLKDRVARWMALVDESLPVCFFGQFNSMTLSTEKFSPGSQTRFFI